MTRRFSPARTVAALAPALLAACAATPRAAPLASSPLAAAEPALAAVRARAPEDEVIYFLLPDRFANGDPSNDRGGLAGDRLATGFDPTDKGFFHGGDLAGLAQRLDYIQGLGASAIWLSPIFVNKPVQGAPGSESAGYHGYWVTDFTRVDPHLGSDEEFKALVDAAHARGMKVYMDIIPNHTADVLFMAECEGQECAYRSKADYPYARRASDGAAINPGFAGEDDHGAANFAALTDPNYAYTVKVPEAEKAIKKPDWLNDPIYYHNRGNSAWVGESAVHGDFVGLDDLMTEHPRVIEGMIEIYGSWIDRGIDGFRIDTFKHVDSHFWRQFIPAMLDRARARGIPNFHIFGEVATGDMDPALQAHYTHEAALPSALDFAVRRAIEDVVVSGKGTEVIARLALGDALYKGGEAVANRNPTFTGNHDFGRLGGTLRQRLPKASEDELLKRAMLGNALMFALRGVPTIYAGDEQGFTGDGGDRDARETLFASKVAVYNDNRLLGTSATTAQDNYDTAHPLYRQIAALAAIRHATPALRHGRTRIRHAGNEPGLIAFSRLAQGEGEVVFAANSSDRPLTVNVEVEPTSRGFTALSGRCPAAVWAPSSLRLTLEPFGYVLCKATR